MYGNQSNFPDAMVNITLDKSIRLTITNSILTLTIGLTVEKSEPESRSRPTCKEFFQSILTSIPNKQYTCVFRNKSL